MTQQSSSRNPISTLCKTFGLVAAGLFWTALAAQATLWVRVSDEALVRQAVDRGGVIVQVEAGELRAAHDAPTPSTLQDMAVRRVLHGEVSGGAISGDEAAELTVRWRGGETADGLFLRVHGVEPLRPGATAILFLKPGHEGTWDALHLFQGVFETTSHAGRDYAFRTLGGVEVDAQGHVLTPSGETTGVRGERARELAPFVEWIRGVAAGGSPAADYWRDVPLEALRQAADAADQAAAPDEKFTVFSRPFRWLAFDFNQTVTFRAHRDGQNGLSGGGFGEFQNALSVWNNDPGSDVLYRYGGQTGASSGFNGQDFVNTIIFNNLNNAGDFDEPFSCTQGGVIAVGGGYAIPNDHTHRGQSFGTTVEADIVTNENTACLLDDSATAREVFGHELGHTLGLGHSCGDDRTGSCAGKPLLNDALMRATVHADGRGARLNDDDRAGINFLYPAEAQQPPSAPTGLSASNAGLATVNLNWNDTANNESGFFVERNFADQGFEQIASIPANRTFYQDAEAPTGSVVTYRVRAFNGAGTSGFTNNASVTTSGPTPPTGLLATSLSPHAIALSWTANTSDETGFEIQIQRLPVGDFATIAVTDPGVTEWVFDEMMTAVPFAFRVRALTETGDSSWSIEAVGVTEPYEVGEACEPGEATLCLNGGRFQNRLIWRDFDGKAGFGNRIESDQSTDSGLFWFFGEENWEMLVKNLDGCGINEVFWVFSAATTNVEYTLQVIDTWTGEGRLYFNPLGTAAPAVTDTGAFSNACDVISPLGSSPPAASAIAAAKADGCVSATTGTDTTLFLNDGRFEVEVDWRDFEGGTGPGRVVQFCSEDSGLFWFFGENNWEMLVKVLDACSFNDRYWVFSAATTNVGFTLRVTDTERGVTRTYVNPLGQPADANNDTDAFDTCP